MISPMLSESASLWIIFGCVSVTLFVTVGLLWYGWAHRAQVGAAVFCVGIASQGLWTLAFIGFAASPQLSAKLFAENLEWTFDAISILTLLWCALEYIGHPWARQWKRWALIALPLAGALVLIYTNPIHSLYFANVELVLQSPYNGLRFDTTPLNILTNVYEYGLALIGVVLVVRHYFTVSPWFRIQISILLLGVAVSLARSVLSLGIESSIRSPVDGLPLVVLFAIGSIILGLGFFRLHLFEMSPIARSYVMDTLADMVIVLDLQGRVVDGNQAAHDYAGMSRDQFTGRPIEAIFPAWRDDLARLIGEDGSQMQLASDQRRFELKLRPINDAHARRIGRLLLIRDVTEQERLAEAKANELSLTTALEKEHELSQLKSEMMVRIAHEFRTPLSSISLNNEMLDRYINRMNDERRREKIEEIQRQVEHLTHLLDDIELVVRENAIVANVSFSTFDIESFCHVAGQAATEQFGSEPVTVTTEANGRLIYTNAEDLQLILFNLLANAIKYSGPGRPIRLEQSIAGDDLLVRVVDDGIGISEADQKRIFEPFFRGGNVDQIGGLGLGLTIVQVLVNSHNGSIQITSAPGQGTSVLVRLPNVAVNETPMRLDDRAMLRSDRVPRSLKPVGAQPVAPSNPVL